MLDRMTLFGVIVVLFTFFSYEIAGILTLLLLTPVLLPYIGYPDDKRDSQPKPQHSLYMTQQRQLVQLLLLQQAYRRTPAQFPSVEAGFEHLLETSIAEKLAELDLSPAEKQAYLEAGWDWLSMQTSAELGTPFWQQTEAKPPDHPTITEHQPDKPPPAAIHPAKPSDTTQTEVQPKAPQSTLTTRLNQLLQHTLFPLVWNNIGWLIGAVCFVSGSVFLVTYTSGSLQSLFIIVTLLFYALLLLWGGHHIQRHHPHNQLASHALITLSILLTPLSLAASVRWLYRTETLFLPAFGVSIGLIIVSYWIAHLAIRFIQGQSHHAYAFLFSLIVAAQLAMPFIAWQQHWYGMGVAHFGLLFLLAYALSRFMPLYATAFNAYYTMVTLIFAALVSFIHLSWGSGVSLPAGYFGVLLMSFTGLLFYLDWQLQRNVPQYPRLNDVTFLIYALSSIAVLLARVNPLTTHLTLALATLLYALMLWRYVSVPALYLLVASSSALYASLILRSLPFEWYFLASLPLLGLIGVLFKWASQHQKTDFVMASCRLFIACSVLLLGWSLYHATPGYLATLTSLTATAISLLVWWRLDEPQWQRCIALPIALPRLYLPAVLAILVSAYLPIVWHSWTWQFAHTLLLLAALWTLPWRFNIQSQAIWLSLALLQVGISLGLITLLMPAQLPYIAFVASGVMLWLSLETRIQRLFQASLLLLSGVILWCDAQYALSSHGCGLLGGGLLVWFWVWWLQRLPYITTTQAYTFHFWTLHVHHNRIGMVLLPLRQWLWLFWLFGLGQLGVTTLQGGEGWIHSTAFALAALFSLLLAGQWQQYWLLPLALLLANHAVLSSLPWVHSATVTATTVLVWLLGHGWLTKTQYLIGQLDDRKAGQAIYLTALLSVLTAILASISLVVAPMGLASYLPSVWYEPYASLSIGVFFFALADRIYNKCLQRYLLLVAFTTLSFFAYTDIQHLPYHDLFNPLPITPLFAPLAIFWAQLATHVGTHYQQPLKHIAMGLWIWSLLETLYLFGVWWQNGATPDTTLPIFFWLLAIGTLPLLRDVEWTLWRQWDASWWRGLLIPVLLILAWLSNSGIQTDLTLMRASLLWSVAFWLMATYMLPRFNRVFPYWAIRMPLLMLASVLLQLLAVGLALHHWQHHAVVWVLAATTIYSHVLLWQFRAVVLAWGAVLMLLITGCYWIYQISGGDFTQSSQWAYVAWFNVLPYLNLTRLSTPNLNARLAAILPSQHQTSIKLEVPLFYGGYLGSLAMLVTMHSLYSFELAALLTLSMLHFTWLKPHWLSAHALLFTCLQLWLLFEHNLPLQLATALVGFNVLYYTYPTLSNRLTRFSALTACYAAIAQAAQYWSISLFYFTVGLLVTHLIPSVSLPHISLATWLIMISILTLHSIVWQWHHWTRILGVILLHGHWQYWLPTTAWWLYLPFIALQNSLLLTFLVCWRKTGSRLAIRTARQYTPLLAVLSGITVIAAMATYAGMKYTALLFHARMMQLTAFDWILTASSGLLLIGLWWHRVARRPRDDRNLYLLASMIFIYLLFLRVAMWGYTPFSLWDTGSLILMSYALVIWQYGKPHPTLTRLSYFLPLLALLTIPWQLASFHASGTVVVIATLYLLLPCQAHCATSKLTGLALFNIAAYLWIPHLVSQLQLLQLYTVPAASSILFMLQAHRADIKPKLAHHVRLIALSILYAGVGTDVFLRPELAVFVFALCLGLLGVGIGIVLRLKAFLYSATLFMLFSILMQLLHYAPQDTLGKALILMILGGMIMTGMIILNLKRDVIQHRLQQWQANWEKWR